MYEECLKKIASSKFSNGGKTVHIVYTKSTASFVKESLERYLKMAGFAVTLDDDSKIPSTNALLVLGDGTKHTEKQKDAIYDRSVAKRDIIPILMAGDHKTAFQPSLWDSSCIDFRSLESFYGPPSYSNDTLISLIQSLLDVNAKRRRTPEDRMMADIFA
jgi:hypothetical protein